MAEDEKKSRPTEKRIGERVIDERIAKRAEEFANQSFRIYDEKGKPIYVSHGRD